MASELLKWRAESTPEQWKQLAKLSGTTPGYLNQLAYGFRAPSKELAQKLEESSKKFKLPRLSKMNLLFPESSSAA